MAAAFELCRPQRDYKLHVARALGALAYLEIRVGSQKTTGQRASHRRKASQVPAMREKLADSLVS